MLIVYRHRLEECSRDMNAYEIFDLVSLDALRKREKTVNHSNKNS